MKQKPAVISRTGKLICLLMALALTFAMSSCAEPARTSSQTTAAESGEAESVADTKDDTDASTGNGSEAPDVSTAASQNASSGTNTESKFMDLKGRTVKLFMWGYSKEWSNSVESGRLMEARYKDIGTKFNCVFKVVAGPSETDFAPINQSILAGVPSVDIIETAGPHTLAEPIKGGLYQDLNQFGVFNWKMSKWNKQVNDIGNFGGKQYIASANLEGSDKQLTNQVMFFNKRLVQSAGYNPDDLYKWQKEGTWNWTKYEEIATKISKLDPGKVWGTVGNDKLLYEMLTITNGCDYIKKDGKSISFNAGDSRALAALELYKRLYTNKVMPEDDSFSNAQMFLEGKVGLMPEILERLRYTNTYGKMKDDYGVIMLPKGPSASDYVSPLAWYSGYAIPKGAKDSKGLALIIDYMTESLYTNKAAENKAVTLARESYVRDAKSMEIFDMVASRTVITPQWLAEPVRGTWLALLTPIKKGETTAADAISKNSGEFSTVLKTVWDIK